MAAPIDIGTLSGRIEFADYVSKSLDAITSKLDAVEKGFNSTGRTVAASAAGFITAEAAINAASKAAEFAVSTLKDLTVEGAGIADVEDNFAHLTEQAGRLGDTLLGSLREGTHATIDDLSLIKIANADLAAGLTLTDDQFKLVADSAFALAQATGEDVKTALDKVNDALLTGRTRGVQMLTGTIDLEAAQKELAATLGVTTDRLTADEQVQASRTALLTKLGEVTGRLGEQSDGLDEKIAQLNARFSNWYDELAKSVATSPAVIQAFDTISEAVTNAFGGDGKSLIDLTVQAIDYFANKVTEYGPMVVEALVKVKDFGVQAWTFLSDAAAEYGPIVIKWLGYVKDWVIDVASTVKSTWDALPDWFKKAGAEALLFGAAASTTVRATSTLFDAFTTGLNVVAGFATTISGVGPAVTLAGQALEALGVSATAATSLIGPLTIAVAGLTAGFIAWQGASAESGWIREFSDGFEYAALRLQGYSEAEADAMIATDHMTQQAREQQVAVAKAAEAVKENADNTIEQANAAKLAATEVALKTAAQNAAAEADRRSAEEIKKWNEAMASLAITGKDLNAVLYSVDGQVVEGIKYYLDRGVAADQLAVVYGLTKTQIDAVVESHKKETDAMKAATDAAKDQAAALNKLQGLSKDLDKTLAGIPDKIEQQAKEWLELGGSAADVGKALGLTDEQVEAIQRSMDKAAASTKTLGDGLTNNVGLAADRAAEKIQALNGAWETLDERAARQSSGGSYTYDLSTQAGLNQYKQLNTGASYSLSDAQIIQQAKSGKTLQQFIQEGVINPYGMWGSMGQNSVSSIPMFADGGIATKPTLGIFGEAGPEALIPLDNLPMSSPVINNYINGTAEDVARKVSQQIMKDLKSVRQFGAA